jgi:hypothetical protein
MVGEKGIIEVMTPSEAEDLVLKLLAENGPMTTMDIERAASASNRRCPDQTVLFLTKMKGKGLSDIVQLFDGILSLGGRICVCELALEKKNIRTEELPAPELKLELFVEARQRFLGAGYRTPLTSVMFVAESTGQRFLALQAATQ